MTKRNADEMEDRTNAYVTRIQIFSGEVCYSHLRGSASSTDLAFLKKNQCSYPSIQEEISFFKQLELVMDKKCYSNHWEWCTSQEIAEKPALHFIFQGEGDL